MSNQSGEEEKLVIELSGKMYVLTLQPFQGDLDIDEILKVDYSNILGEVLTFPVLFNRIGLLKAEVDSLVSVEKFDLEVLKAQLGEEARRRMVSLGEKPTELKIENAVLLDIRYTIKTKEYYKLVKNQDYISALYWSAKSKDGKLDRLTEKLRPEEFSRELLEDTVNGVLIKSSRKVLE